MHITCFNSVERGASVHTLVTRKQKKKIVNVATKHIEFRFRFRKTSLCACVCGCVFLCVSYACGSVGVSYIYTHIYDNIYRSRSLSQTYIGLSRALSLSFLLPCYVDFPSSFLDRFSFVYLTNQTRSSIVLPRGTLQRPLGAS